MIIPDALCKICKCALFKNGEKITTRETCEPCLKEKRKKIGYEYREKNKSKWNAKRFNITPQEYENITKECSICLMNKGIINCHHIIPKSKGGENIFENYRGLCPNCHQLLHRGSKVEEIIKYYEELGIPVKLR